VVNEISFFLFRQNCVACNVELEKTGFCFFLLFFFGKKLLFKSSARRKEMIRCQLHSSGQTSFEV
jgi:hypothetical protein